MSGFTPESLEMLSITNTQGVTRAVLKRCRRQLPRLTRLLETTNLLQTEAIPNETKTSVSAGIAQFLRLGFALVDRDDARLVEDFLECCKAEILVAKPPSNTLVWPLLKNLLANTMDEDDLIEALTATQEQPTLKRRNAMPCDQWVSADDNIQSKRRKSTLPR